VRSKLLLRLTSIRRPLKAGERWSYSRQPDTTVGWIAVGMGTVLVRTNSSGRTSAFTPSGPVSNSKPNPTQSSSLGSAVVPHELRPGLGLPLGAHKLPRTVRGPMRGLGDPERLLHGRQSLTMRHHGASAMKPTTYKSIIHLAKPGGCSLKRVKSRKESTHLELPHGSYQGQILKAIHAHPEPSVASKTAFDSLRTTSSKPHNRDKKW